jgi:hypothetical protein
MSWSQSSERKFDNEIRATPENVGPGLYDISLTIGNKKPLKAPFGTRSKREVFPVSNEDVPPPGFYDAKLDSKDITISSVFHSNSKRGYFRTSQTPDPTRYSSQKQWGKITPKPKRYKLPVPENRPMTVFYGQKNVNQFKTNKKGEWVPIKVKERGPEEVGPGSYEPYNSRNDPRVPITINQHQGRSNIFSRSHPVPGPGEYSPVITNKRKLLPTISKSRAKENVPDDASGYVDQAPWVSEEEKRQPTAAFRSKEKRDPFQVNTTSPGPATYYRNTQLPIEYFDNSCFGVRAERKIMEVNNTYPGPGHYNVRDQAKTSTGVKIHSLVNPPVDAMADVPGPGAYGPSNTSLVTSQRPSSVFASKVPRKIDSSNGIPGPGRYSPVIHDKSRVIPLLIKEGSRDDSWVNKTQMENPDPTAYQHVIIEPKGGITISNIDRKEVINTNPGPGHYDVLHDSLLNRSFNSGVPDLTKF